jgi:glucan phosphoethanolaminetransferase (alkaline phosphatase superfamily)
MNDNLVLAVGIVILALMLYWAWLTSPKLFTLGVMAVIASTYIAFMVAIGLQMKKRVMLEERRQEEPKKQTCASSN